MREKVSAEERVREIRRKTRRKYSAEEKVRVVLEGLRGEESIAAQCRTEGIPSTSRPFPRLSPSSARSARTSINLDAG